MTPKSFAIVACRLLSFWFFMQSAIVFIASLNNFFLMRSMGSSAPPVGFPASPPNLLRFAALPMVYLGASVVLWLGASVLAENMTRGLNADVSLQNQPRLIDWQAVGFALLGGFFLLQGLNTLISYFIMKTFMSPSDFTVMFDSETMRLWQQNSLAVTQTVFGLVLLLWSQKTLRVLDYLQRGGRDESANENRQV